MLYGNRIKMALAVIGCITFSINFAAAQTFDASADFDVAHNPSQINGGAFRYGYETAPGSTFNLFLTPYNNSGKLLGWTTGSGVPIAAKNISGSTFYVQPGDVLLHPDSSGDYSVVRFVAPSSGTYTLSSSFDGGPSGATTDVHVLLNSVALFNGNVSGNVVSYSNSHLALSGGDEVDFAVGYGIDGSYLSDSTGLLATLTDVSPATPEPNALIGLSGLCAAFGLTRARHKR